MNATARAVPILTFSKSHGLAHDCNSEASHGPSSRHLQTPYEISLEGITTSFTSLRKWLDALSAKDIASPDLPSLARRLTLSPRTLARRFLDDLGLSPGQWIKDRRLAIARALLEETDLHVAEVCYRIGYEDPASFNRLFSRATGMRPGEHRKQSR